MTVIILNTVKSIPAYVKVPYSLLFISGLGFELASSLLFYAISSLLLLF